MKPPARLAGLLTAHRLPAVLAAAGAVLMLLSAALPWLAGPDSATLPYGYATDPATGTPSLGSRAGLRGGDALAVLAAGALALWPAALLLLGRGRTVHRVTLAGAAALGAAWAALNLAETGTVRDRTGRLPDLTSGPGPYLTLLAALLLVTAAVPARPDPFTELHVRTLRANRLWNNGHYGEALELQQRTLRAAHRSPGPAHPATTSAAMSLIRMYTWSGHPNRAAHLAEKTTTAATQWAPTHPDAYRRLQSDIAELLN
ncbi:hypothetical protein [Streptomyces sp. NPDC048659]|uniref:hypothetical protein n=1 Tax=Streptomyces sp. NPDC048659 TaxID=3155489 RepID=UPI00341E78BA